MWKSFIVLFALLLAACGPKSSTLNVEMKEFGFVPDRFTVKAGAPVTLKLKNIGALEHDFVILALGQEATAPFNEDDAPKVYWRTQLEARKDAVLQFTAPNEPGEYRVVCGVAGHLEQGMTATLVVEP